MDKFGTFNFIVSQILIWIMIHCGGIFEISHFIVLAMRITKVSLVLVCFEFVIYNGHRIVKTRYSPTIRVVQRYRTIHVLIHFAGTKYRWFTEAKIDVRVKFQADHSLGRTNHRIVFGGSPSFGKRRILVRLILILQRNIQGVELLAANRVQWMSTEMVKLIKIVFLLNFLLGLIIYNLYILFRFLYRAHLGHEIDLVIPLFIKLFIYITRDIRIN